MNHPTHWSRLMTPEPSEHEGLHINSAEVAQTLDHPLSREAAKVQEPLDDYTLHPYKDPGLDPLPTFDKSLKYADDGLKTPSQLRTSDTKPVDGVPSLRIRIPSTPVNTPSFGYMHIMSDDFAVPLSSPTSETSASDLSSGYPPSYTDESWLHNSKIEENFSYSPVEKGKWRMPVEDEGATPEPLDNGEPHVEDSPRDLTELERNDITRQDEELAMALLFEDLREQGYSAEQIEEYAIKLQVMQMQGAQDNQQQSAPIHTPSRSNSIVQMESERSIKKVADNILETYMTRDLPPAYGPNYTPEPSTSTAGSPILAARRLSVSSSTDPNSVSVGGDGCRKRSYSNASIIQEDQALELESELERRMEALFMCHRANLLRDWEHMMSSFKHDLRLRERDREGRRMRYYRYREQHYPRDAYDYPPSASRTRDAPPHSRREYDGERDNSYQRPSTRRDDHYAHQRYQTWQGQPH